jgi:ADP-glucose pyrophosphorylase
MSITISQSTIDEAKASVDRQDAEYEAAAIAEKQRRYIRAEDKVSMRNFAKSTELMVSMLSNRENHHEVGTDLILTAMRVAYRLGVDAGRKLPLR